MVSRCWNLDEVIST